MTSWEIVILVCSAVLLPLGVYSFIGAIYWAISGLVLVARISREERHRRLSKEFELDTGEVNRAAREYFTQQYEENRESSMEQDKVVN